MIIISQYFKGTTWLLVLSIILFLGATIWLTLEAGRTAEDEELHLNGFDHWKTEDCSGADRTDMDRWFLYRDSFLEWKYLYDDQ